MLDRMSLSIKNKWIDNSNRVYIIFTIQEIMQLMGCADQKATKLLKELDTKQGIGLIERKRQGLGKPDVIYVKNFILNTQLKNRENHESRQVEITSQESLKSQDRNCDNQSSEIVNIINQETRKSRPSNTNINKTNSSDTEIISYPFCDDPVRNSSSDMIRWIDECKTYKDLIKKNIDYDIIKSQYGSWLDEIILIMIDVICSRSPMIRINKQNYPTDVVKSRFLKITSSHIEYIHDSLKDNTSNVRNIRAFLITTIYNSLETINNFYSAKVNNDLYG